MSARCETLALEARVDGMLVFSTVDDARELTCTFTNGKGGFVNLVEAADGLVRFEFPDAG